MPIGDGSYTKRAGRSKPEQLKALKKVGLMWGQGQP